MFSSLLCCWPASRNWTRNTGVTLFQTVIRSGSPTLHRCWPSSTISIFLTCSIRTRICDETETMLQNDSCLKGHAWEAVFFPSSKGFYVQLYEIISIETKSMLFIKSRLILSLSLSLSLSCFRVISSNPLIVVRISFACTEQ